MELNELLLEILEAIVGWLIDILQALDLCDILGIDCP